MSCARCFGALPGTTYAQDRVHDPQVAPIDESVRDQPEPFIIDATNDETSNVSGHDYIGASCDLDVVIEIALASELRRAGAPNIAPVTGRISSDGQVVAMMTPPGDTRQGFLLRDGFTHQYKPPSQNLQENYQWQTNHRPGRRRSGGRSLPDPPVHTARQARPGAAR